MSGIREIVASGMAVWLSSMYRKAATHLSNERIQDSDEPHSPIIIIWGHKEVLASVWDDGNIEAT